MTYRDRLQRAKFRNIEFYVDGYSGTAGRRNDNHDYPKGERNYCEDMGRVTPEYSFPAWVIGPDCDILAQRLRDSLQDNAEPGVLIHPMFGTVLVKPDACTYTYSKDESGMIRFDLKFIEAGQNTYPAADAYSGYSANTQATTVLGTLKDRFGSLVQVANLPEFINTAAGLIGADFLDQITGRFTDQAGLLSSLTDQAATLQAGLANLVPATFATQATDLLDTYSQQSSDPADDYANLKRLTTFGADYPAVPETTSTRHQQAVNQTNLVQLIRFSATIFMATTAIALEYDSYNEAVATRDEVADLLFTAILAVGDTDADALVQQITELRTLVVQNITARAANLRRLRMLNTARALPSLFIAYDLYEDLTYEADIIARNKIRHPAFCPVELQVLTA